MRIVEYNGREIKTNLGGNYPFCDGNDKKTLRMYISDSIRESDEEMFERIAKKRLLQERFKVAELVIVVGKEPKIWRGRVVG